LAIPFHFHGKHDVRVPGVQVAEEVLKSSFSMWPNCEDVIYISVPAFWFYWAGVDGFHFEALINMLASRGIMEIPWWLLGIVGSWLILNIQCGSHLKARLGNNVFILNSMCYTSYPFDSHALYF
jgi:hypothetical protein